MFVIHEYVNYILKVAGMLTISRCLHVRLLHVRLLHVRLLDVLCFCRDIVILILSYLYGKTLFIEIFLNVLNVQNKLIQQMLLYRYTYSRDNNQLS